jgi:small GTP-binding protein
MGRYIYAGLAFSPKQPILATTSARDKQVNLWRYEISALPEEVSNLSPIRYKNAKIALVGDTGVGKSGLNLVLTGQKFAPTESTHARRISSLDVTQVVLPSGHLELRERLLWDLAGQPGYRIIHQLHLDDISVSLLVFDSRSEVDPFAGVRHWNRALMQAARLGPQPEKSPSRILVAARCDRGPLSISDPRLQRLQTELDIKEFVQTSAKDGTGIDELQQKIEKMTDWSGLPSVSSNEIFQKIRAFIVSERTQGRLLTTVGDLRRDFLQSVSENEGDPKDIAMDFSACIGRLQAVGLLRRFSFGDLILLRPELLDAYASSILFAAKQEPDGMGCILEDDVRACRFKIDAEQQIDDASSEKLLVLATIEDLLLHEVAFREPAETGALLVFPSQLTRENPALPDPPGKETVLEFQGGVLNIYAMLIVRLSHSGIFLTAEMWKNAATFSAKSGGTCGVFLTETGEGAGTITLFYDSNAGPLTRLQFGNYVYTHLVRRALPNSVTRSTVITCPRQDCGTAIDDEIVRKRLSRGFDWVACNVCDTKIPLLREVDAYKDKSAAAVDEIDRKAKEQQLIDTTLVSASGEMQTLGFQRWVGANMSTLAIVFTDVVGSTALATEVGDEEMERIRGSHFQRTRTLLGKYSGYEIKTIGDSFMAAFRTAVAALNFCLDIHKNSGHESISVRAGVHVGPIHIEEEDAFGAMVNYASRVQARAKGAEIWVSDRAHEDILAERAKAHKDLDWIRHPNCVLKGFKGKQRLWSLK